MITSHSVSLHITSQINRESSTDEINVSSTWRTCGIGMCTLLVCWSCCAYCDCDRCCCDGRGAVEVAVTETWQLPLARIGCRVTGNLCSIGLPMFRDPNCKRKSSFKISMQHLLWHAHHQVWMLPKIRLQVSWSVRYFPSMDKNGPRHHIRRHNKATIISQRRVSPSSKRVVTWSMWCTT